MEPRTAGREVRREVRFAVVMYGGVSLAIYINGVVRELFRMVRATATVSPNCAKPLVPYKELSGSERVYRHLGQTLGREGEERDKPYGTDDPISTKFVIDILSGTSAGGINAVYLAKALANGQEIKQLSELWVEEGDIGKLINDKASVKGLDGLGVQRPPGSLLNGQRMYRRLLDAFDCMEEEKESSEEAKSPYIEDLDLFVTSTDFYGLPVPLRLFGKAVDEHRHRNVYWLRYIGKYREKPHNDFLAKNNPFLAFAARSTSAFPFAFAPIKLADIDAVLQKTPKYRKLRGLGRDRERWQEFFPAAYRQYDFTDRAFVDGGYLDNKPFGYAVDAIASRSSDVPVDRKLIFIDPAPKHLKDRGANGEVPNAIKNVAGVFTLPRYETIREDLQRILHRNRLIERAQIITSKIEEAVPDGLALPEDNDNWDLARVIRAKGVAYGGYHRLKVSAVSDEITAMIAHAGGFDPDSDEFFAIRYLVRAWRESAYTASSQEAERDGKETENKFLARYDLLYHLRRLNFVLAKIDQLRDLSRQATIETFKQRNVAMPETEEQKKAFRVELTELRAQLSHIYACLYRTREKLHTFGQKNPIATAVAATGLTRERLREFLEEPDEDSRLKKADCLVSESAVAFGEIADLLEKYIEERMVDADDRCWYALKSPEPGEELRSFAAEVRTLVRPCYYVSYDQYDLVSFPILHATGVGDEIDPVEIARISPEDAIAVDGGKLGSRKLAGIAFRSFGAFFDRGWRRNDILWGKLDGAERIVTMLLHGSGYTSQERDDLIREAQYEILIEELGSRDQDGLSTLLAEAAAEAGVQHSPGSPSEAPAPCKQRAFLKAFGEREIYRSMESESAVRALSRSTQVVGKMLEGIAEDYRTEGKQGASWLATPGTWLARLGRVLWGLVEVSVPNSLARLLYRHVLKLLYLFEALLIVAGTVFAEPKIQLFGLLTLLITATAHFGSLFLGDLMLGGRRRTDVSWLLKAPIVLFAVVVVLLAVLGGYQLWVDYLSDIWQRLSSA